MPSNADAVDAALADAADRVERAVAALPSGALPVILIDGRSGAGKSTLAALIERRWRGPVQVLALDELYPGWDGLAAASELIAAILTDVAAGRTATWRRWDWEAHAPGQAKTTLPDIPLIVEGCGALTAATAALAPVRVWLEAPGVSRRRRALARDGDAYRPHWDRWAAQELRHIADDDPTAHATIVIDVP